MNECSQVDPEAPREALNEPLLYGIRLARLLKNLTTRRLAGVANFGSHSGVVTKLTRTKVSV